jgi:hypothetical protein
MMIQSWLAESTIPAQLLGELNAAGMQMDSEGGKLFTNLYLLGFGLKCIILEVENDIFVLYNLILDTHRNPVLNCRLGENIPWEIHQIFQNILFATNAESLQGLYSLLLYFYHHITIKNTFIFTTLSHVNYLVHQHDTHGQYAIQ